MGAFTFDIRPEDAEKCSKDMFDEENNLVATAFRRNFPGVRLVRAHGDYYVSVGKGDGRRYVFRPESTMVLDKLYRTGENFHKTNGVMKPDVSSAVTVVACSI